MIFVELVEAGSDKMPKGFNCGPTDVTRANLIVTNLVTGLNGGMEVRGPVQTNNRADLVITVTCRPGSLEAVTNLVEVSLAIMRRRQQI